MSFECYFQPEDLDIVLGWDTVLVSDMGLIPNSGFYSHFHFQGQTKARGPPGLQEKLQTPNFQHFTQKFSLIGPQGAQLRDSWDIFRGWVREIPKIMKIQFFSKIGSKTASQPLDFHKGPSHSTFDQSTDFYL